MRSRSRDEKVQHKDSTMQTTLKITSTETRKSETKGPYTYGKADMIKKDGSIRPVTIMAFGAQRDSVKNFLRKGRTVTVTAVFDGGVVKILGPKAAPKVAAEAVAA
jgi:hypothetical protein